jgi:hypothetical protein
MATYGNVVVQDMTTTSQNINSLVMNGGFEYPTLLPGVPYLQVSVLPPPLGGWTIAQSDCVSGSAAPNINLVSNIYWDSAEGLQSIDLNGDGNTAPSISQSIITVPGFNHRVGWQESMNYEGGQNVSVSYQFKIPSVSFQQTYTVQGDARRNARNMMYTRRWVEFKATGAQTEIRFDSCSNTDKGPVLDDVVFSILVPSMTNMPLPSPSPTSTASFSNTTNNAIVVVNTSGLSPGQAAGISIGVIGICGLLLFIVYLYNRTSKSNHNFVETFKTKMSELYNRIIHIKDRQSKDHIVTNIAYHGNTV